MNTFDLSNTIAKNLKKLRKERKITQAKVVDIIGEHNLSLRTYKDYEAGKTMPDIDKMVMLADFYGCSLDFLIKGKETMFNDSFTWIDTFKRLNRLIYPLAAIPKRITDESNPYCGKYMMLIIDKETNEYLAALDSKIGLNNLMNERGIMPILTIEAYDKVCKQFSFLKGDLRISDSRLAKYVQEIGYTRKEQKNDL